MTARVIHFARSETEVAQTSTSVWADCVTLDFSAEANTDYYILVNWKYNHGSTSNAALFRLTVDNSLVGEQYRRDGEATDEEITGFILHRHQQGGSPGTVSLALEVLSESGSTVTFRAGAIVCIKKASTDAYAEDLTDNTYTSGTWSSVASVAEGVGTGDQILVIGQMNHGSSATSFLGNQIRLYDGSTGYYGHANGMANNATSDRITAGLFYTQSAPAGSTTWSIQAAEMASTTMTSYGARILVLDVSGVTGATGIGSHTSDLDTDSSTANVTSGTTFVDLVTRTSQTFSASYTYLFLGHATWLTTSGGVDGRHRNRIDSTVRPDTSDTYTEKVDTALSNDPVNYSFMDYEVGDGGTTHSYDFGHANSSGGGDDVETYDYSLIVLEIDVYSSVSVTVTPSGVSATGAVGDETVSTVQNTTISVTGVSATGAVGDEAIFTNNTVGWGRQTGWGSLEWGQDAINVTVSVSGVSATGAVGNETVSGDAVVVVTGVSATGATGSVTVVPETRVSVTGPPATGAVGTVLNIGTANVLTTGPPATGAVGDEVVSGEAVVPVSGTSAVGAEGSVTVELTRIYAPSSDVSLGSWTDQAGGTTNIYQSIDEPLPANDSDYVRSPYNPSSNTYEAGLGTITDPVASTGHYVHYRYHKLDAVGQMDLTVKLMQGAVEIASWSHTDISNSPVTASQLLTGPQTDAITNYNDLRLQFIATQVA